MPGDERQDQRLRCRDTYPTYGLPKDVLTRYLTKEFGQKIEISDETVMSDRFVFYLPRRLTGDERQEIAHIRSLRGDALDQFINSTSPKGGVQERRGGERSEEKKLQDSRNLLDQLLEHLDGDADRLSIRSQRPASPRSATAARRRSSVASGADVSRPHEPEAGLDVAEELAWTPGQPGDNTWG